MDRIWAGGASDSGGIDLSGLMTDEDNGADSHLVEYEINGLIAYHLELARTGVIKADESREILKGLTGLVGKEIIISGDIEDVHSLIQFRMSQISEAGKNLRIFLSRNDQSHTDIRSFYMDSLLETALLLSDTAATAKESQGGIKGFMAGYTHYRQAMPVSFATYFDYICSNLLDLAEDALNLYGKLSESCPMGYASGYGSSIPADFNRIAVMLGFRKAFVNPVHGASYRGMDEMEVAFLESKVLTFISRISQDFILFSSDEFGFLELPPGFSTGSSLMPNKKNPDFLEMLQGYASEALSTVVMSISAAMNRATGYHREFQLSKDKAIKFTLRVNEILKALNGLLGNIRIDNSAARRLIGNAAYATMDAFSLFSRGMPWKDAYKKVGEKIADGSPIDEYAPEDFISASENKIAEQRRRIIKMLEERREIGERLVREAYEFISAH